MRNSMCAEQIENLDVTKKTLKKRLCLNWMFHLANFCSLIFLWICICLWKCNFFILKSQSISFSHFLFIFFQIPPNDSLCFSGHFFIVSPITAVPIYCANFNFIFDYLKTFILQISLCILNGNPYIKFLSVFSTWTIK